MKRKITLIIFVIFTSLYGSSVLADDYLGKYVTKPTIFPGFSEPYTEQVKKAMKHMTWNLQITEREPEVMPYTKEGSFLLARQETSKIIKYVTFYIENGEKIHGLNTVFFKEKK